MDSVKYKILSVFCGLFFGFMMFFNNCFANVIPTSLDDYYASKYGGAYTGSMYVYSSSDLTTSTDGNEQKIYFRTTPQSGYSLFFLPSTSGDGYYWLKSYNFTTKTYDNDYPNNQVYVSAYCRHGESTWTYSNGSSWNTGIGLMLQPPVGRRYDTNLPVFSSLDGASKYFVDGDNSDCLNWSSVSGSLPTSFDSTMPTIDNLRWNTDADAWRTNPYAQTATSQYGDYGALSWDISNPNAYDIEYDIGSMVDGIYNTFTNGTEVGSSSTMFHSKWKDIYNASSKTSVYNYLDADSRRYCTSLSWLEVNSMPYFDKDENSLDGVNLQGFRYSDVLFRVRAKRLDGGIYYYGDWSVASYNLKDNSFHVYDTGNTDAISSDNETGSGTYDTGGNKWVDDTNSKYSYTPDDTDILTNIKTGFGLLGDNGLLKLLADLFAFVPKEIFIVIISGVSLGVLIFILKFIRG